MLELKPSDDEGSSAALLHELVQGLGCVMRVLLLY